jgi:hypothetical protein
VPHSNLAFSIGTRQIHVKATAAKTTACIANPQILRELPGGLDNSGLLALLIVPNADIFVLHWQRAIFGRASPPSVLSMTMVRPKSLVDRYTLSFETEEHSEIVLASSLR